MGLESGTWISDLVPTNPIGPTDPKSQGDDHLRLIKGILQNTFPRTSKAFYFPDSQAKSGNYTVLAEDENRHFGVNATAADRTLTLPVLGSTNAGWKIQVTKTDSSTNKVILAGTVNGITNYQLLQQYETVFLIWTGTAWFAGPMPFLPLTVVSKTATATLALTEMYGVVLCSPAAAMNIVPDESKVGAWVWIKNVTGAFAVTINPTGANTIDGATTFALSQANEAVLIVKTGTTTWAILAHKIDVTIPTIIPPTSSVVNLQINVGAASPSSHLDITADEAILVKPNGDAIKHTGISLTLNLGSTGLNGLDTGGTSPNRKYYVWLISDGTTVGCIAHFGDTSPPSPMPAGYSYKKLISWCRLDGSSALFQMTQRGADAQYYVANSNGLNPTSVIVLAEGATAGYDHTTPTLDAIDWTNVAPPEATLLRLLVSTQTNLGGPTFMIVAPNVRYGGSQDGPLGSNKQMHSFWNTTTQGGQTTTIDFVPEATSFGYASANAGGRVGILGWRVPWV